MRTYDSIDEAMPQIYRDLVEQGVSASPRGLDTKEIEDYQFRLADGTQGISLLKSRKLNYSLIALEYMSYAAGLGGTREHADLMKIVAPNFAAFIDQTTGILNGAYGPRIGTQIDDVISLLTKDPDSRQAQIIITRPHELHRVLEPEHLGADKDFPCTQLFTFRVRQNKLNMSTVMRSNDIYWGTPYDVAAFTLLQRLMASMLRLEVGTYTHYAASIHMYENSHDKLREAYVTNELKGGKVTLEPQLFPEGLSMIKIRQTYRQMLEQRAIYENYKGCSAKVRRDAVGHIDEMYAAVPHFNWLWLMLTRRGVKGSK